MRQVNAYATQSDKAKLKPYEYTLPSIGPNQVDIKVKYCGICYSDVSMCDNDWGITQYPFVPGHEVVGTVVEKGDHVQNLKVGDEVGLGWFSGSCMHCYQCLTGNHNLCGSCEQTVVSRHGGYADHVRCDSIWALPIPKGLDLAKLGPMFCGGITAFNQIYHANVKPTDRVGVIGLGGIGHLAIQFLNKCGCEVTVFTSSTNKNDEARKFGAHHIINSRDDAELEKVAGSFDFILNTVYANLNWEAYINALAPMGRLHTVGVVPDPIPVPSFPIILGQKTVSGNPLGSPAAVKQMLEFSARHSILPTIEEFAMSDLNEAIEHLKSGNARYRIVLRSDF